jgi:hypothetical protein
LHAAHFDYQSPKLHINAVREVATVLALRWEGVVVVGVHQHSCTQSVHE